MSSPQAVALLLLLLCGLHSANAWWKCHECINSFTVNLQVTPARFAGSDNEGPMSHHLDLLFACNPIPLFSDLSELLEKNDHLVESLIPNITLPEFKSKHPASVAFDTVRQDIPLDGIILRLHSRTYTEELSVNVTNICGTCVTPKMIKEIAIKAGNTDGIQVRSVSVFANFKDKTSGFVALDTRFPLARGFGWVDTNHFPSGLSQTVLPLTKTGC
ncbi:uncharacterized protein LOC135821406 [Sycon ciliatum]|uniref:uncharacterized protein LOC135821406 n=1 Tax=Sycon ciliatum TaxID=27933 RepID=UPI0031F6B434